MSIRCVVTLFALSLALLSLPAPTAAQEAAEPKPRQEARTSALINLNTATADELESLPGVGAQMAARILEYRQKHGAFKKVEDLMNVKGIGEKGFLKLKPLITVAGRGERPSN
jgi:competence protein ComEA